MSLADKIRDAKAQWERKPQDFYPTPANVTQALLDYMKFSGPMRVHEPCCGEGHMAYVLERAGCEVTASDIEYTGYGQGGVDYLTLPEGNPEFYDYDAVITNPPFSKAEDIIRRAMRDAPIVAMLLPSGYWHGVRRSMLFETRRPEIILSLTWRPAFLEEERGKNPLMNVDWVVWIDDSEYTGIQKRLTSFDLLHQPVRFPQIPKPTTEMLMSRHGNGTALGKSLEAALAVRLR
jgi:hypothetical protein